MALVEAAAKLSYVWLARSLSSSSTSSLTSALVSR
jgi:hypothetical protein